MRPLSARRPPSTYTVLPVMYDAVPRRLGELEEGHDGLDGRVRDGDVDAPPRSVDRLEAVADRCGVGDVHVERQRAAAPEPPRRRPGRVRIDVGDRDLRALAGERERDRLADAAPSARDERHLALEPHGVDPPPSPLSGPSPAAGWSGSAPGRAG